MTFRQAVCFTDCDVFPAAVSVSLRGMPKQERPSETVLMAGRRLKAARIALGMRVEEFANSIGVEQTRMSNWTSETNPRLPDVMAMVRLWHRWGIPMEWIYAGDLHGVPYGLGQKLTAAAAEVGAVVGAPEREWPAAVERRPGAYGAATPAAPPPPKAPRGSMLHEAQTGKPGLAEDQAPLRKPFRPRDKRR